MGRKETAERTADKPEAARLEIAGLRERIEQLGMKSGPRCGVDTCRRPFPELRTGSAIICHHDGTYETAASLREMAQIGGDATIATLTSVAEWLVLERNRGYSPVHLAERLRDRLAEGRLAVLGKPLP